jgi:hypothetical protein
VIRRPEPLGSRLVRHSLTNESRLHLARRVTRKNHVDPFGQERLMIREILQLAAGEFRRIPWTQDPGVEEAGVRSELLVRRNDGSKPKYPGLFYRCGLIT